MKLISFIDSYSHTRKLLVVVMIAVAVNAVQYFVLGRFPQYHDQMRHLYYLPVVLGGLLLNAYGAFLFTCFVILIFNVHMSQHGSLHVAENIFQSGLFLLLSFASSYTTGQIRTLNLRLQKSKMQFFQSLSNVLDSRDKYTEGHSIRVANISRLLGSKMGLDAGSLDDLYLAGLLHDIGKIGIPDEILKKEGRLTASEYRRIQKHPKIGRSIMSDMEGYEDILNAVYHHHERFDGTGYPDNLKNGEIPLYSSIIAVADAFDALTSQRSYNKRMSAEEAIALITGSSEGQFDPSILEVFKDLQEELLRISEANVYYLDPVCKMKVHPETCAAWYKEGGQSYYFCSRECYNVFLRKL